LSFTSFSFICIFLPTLLVIYLFSEPKNRNYIVLLASILFFSIGQILYLPLLGALIIINYFLGKRLENLSNRMFVSRVTLSLGILANLLPLVFYKYITTYGVEWLPKYVPLVFIKYIQTYLAPLGLSYLVFQLISYLIDIFRGHCFSEKKIVNFALYVMLFPKLFVGPIVRYRDISKQLSIRETNRLDVGNGIRRFIQGLVKKIIVADTISAVVNPAFSLATPNYSTSLAWFVLIGYSIQLYFDFSGFTDMAIGLGQMLGFRFMENFNYPYISTSISEFWRRWHISLSSWFREYVFFPLERVRHKIKINVQPLNILIIFLLIGFWHGFTFNFLLWGGIHGLAVALETIFLGKVLKKVWKPIQHLYTLMLIMIGWVFFRSPSLDYALAFLGRLFGSTKNISPIPFSITQPFPLINNSVWLSLIFGILFSLPVIPMVSKYWAKVTKNVFFLQNLGYVSADLIFFAAFILVASVLASRTNIPVSIYARF
jgi:alginate O-acetyltransferase complex protein AlgI